MSLHNADNFLKSIEIGKIYYFYTNQLVNTTKRHHFITIAISPEDFIIFVCCTTKYEKQKKLIELSNLPESTLVWIKPDGKNRLPFDSYINCNSYFILSKQDLKEMHKKNKISFTGNALESSIEQIKQGMSDSPKLPPEIKQFIFES